MSGKRKFEDAAKEIDAGLGGLFGTLSDAISEVAKRLDEGGAGAVQRDFSFNTSKGPVRAQAGVRLRMGGVDVGDEGGPDIARPVNPDRPATAAETAAPAARDLAYDLLDDGDAWHLTADLPGVTRDEVALSVEGTTLKVTTSGARVYAGEVDLEAEFSLDGVAVTMRNGVLTLQIPKGSPG